MAPFENSGLKEMRMQLISKASGNCLELGVGSGANLLYYDVYKVSHLIASDLDETEKIESKIREKLDLLLEKVPDGNVKVMQLNVENLPFEDNTFDTVVSTLIFCSVPDVLKGLSEIKRVLKPSGTFIFIEHVLSKSPIKAPVMNFLTPAWKTIANGCHLNRDFESALNQSGYSIKEHHFVISDVFYGGIASPS
ncbi:class I SAM-dependent methyltransferase [Fusibacter sp. Q10-2]|uniref:Class I SAM-dependent methyltransferase n=2 Tax=Fusibacter ferrireducens TaxID=2785058 RepID=A0ABR9ZUH9_9FIRM|nr:class I SAM-dependent methyltransferase [Fusibacter ferrireducens]